MSNVAEIITAGAAVAGAIAAWEGLSAWKKQLHGNTDHDIAWKYLEAVLKLRNAINKTVRNPGIDLSEFKSASEEFYGENLESEMKQNPRSAEMIAVYSIRWREVNKARQALDDAIVQAEIWWGQKVVGLEKELNACIGELFVNLKNMLNPDRGLTYNHRTIYYIEGDDNQFDKDLENAVKKMEDFARLYLRDSESEASSKK